MSVEYYRYKHTIKKPAQIRFHSNRPHAITQMNDDIHMDSTIAGSVTVRS